MHTDFSAAHSMDSYWFAVDRDGHVARFDSGEAGAVPVSAVTDGDILNASERLAQLLPCSEAVHDLRGMLVPGPKSESSRHLGRRNHAYGVLMFLPSLDLVQDDLTVGRGRQVPTSEGVAILLRGLSAEEYDRFHQGESCQGCFYFFDEEEEGDAGLDLACRGLFEYGHLTENWISGPYGRERCPRNPLHVDQLPPDIRRLIKQLRLNTLRFADTPHIQPVEYRACESWESAWLDLTGKNIRPIPGREEEYREQYGNLGEETDGYRIEQLPEAGE